MPENDNFLRYLHIYSLILLVHTGDVFKIYSYISKIKWKIKKHENMYVLVFRENENILFIFLYRCIFIMKQRSTLFFKCNYVFMEADYSEKKQLLFEKYISLTSTFVT